MINKISPGGAPDCQAGRTMLLGWMTYICWSMDSLEQLKKICVDLKILHPRIKVSPNWPPKSLRWFGDPAKPTDNAK